MNHIILIRSTFRDEELFQKYLNVAKEVLFPQLNSQTNKNFTVCFLSNSDTHSEIISSYLDDSVKRIFILDPFWKIEFANFLTNNFYEIQTRHDIDDWMSVNYVDTIQKTWVQYKESNPNESMLLIQSQPVLYDFNTTEIKEMKTRYSNSAISMHLSLCQKENKHYVFEDFHLRMHRVTENIILLPSGFTKLVIHNNNMLSDMEC
jgi:hypothetical protein